MQIIPFYDEDDVYEASELQHMLSINKAVYVEDTSFYKYVCQVSKLQQMHVIG